jgi:hypothetical protein
MLGITRPINSRSVQLSLWKNTMNRCAYFGHLFGRPSAFLLSVVFAVFAITIAAYPTPSMAQGMLRQFPAAAKRAVLEVKAPPEVLLNGAVDRLSPGARIHGLTNMLVMSGQMVGQRLVVNYVRNPQGQVHEVWILSEAEALQKRPGMEPVTNYVFGSDADKPKVDDGKTPFNQLPLYKK